MGIPVPLEPKFRASFAPDPVRKCWLWMKAVNRRGYGVIRVNGRSELAHRFSYRKYNGEIPDGLNILHSCDRPCCVNPDHLVVGTQADNMADMRAKGRAGYAAPLTGSDHPNHKLEASDILQIRALAASKVAMAAIARRYHVNHSTVERIVKRKSWKHIGE